MTEGGEPCLAPPPAAVQPTPACECPYPRHGGPCPVAPGNHVWQGPWGVAGSLVRSLKPTLQTISRQTGKWWWHLAVDTSQDGTGPRKQHRRWRAAQARASPPHSRHLRLVCRHIWEAVLDPLRQRPSGQGPQRDRRVAQPLHLCQRVMVAGMALLCTVPWLVVGAMWSRISR